MLSSPILLDYQSSTPCHQEVVDAMKPYWNQIFGNPSSKSNLAGISSSAALEVSREKIIQKLNLKNQKIIFTSGATEANNLALLGYARDFHMRTGSFGNIITLKTEHHAVLEPIRQLAKEGFTITEISPQENGLINQEILLKAIKKDTFLVSIMLANNEIGVIQPVKDIAQICKSRKIIFHTDAAQCIGYLPLNLISRNANMITLSSHKIYGPKGVGLLIIDEDINLEPLLFGGGQEFGFRPGTIPLPLIIGFAKAIEIAINNTEKNISKLSLLRNNLLKGILKTGNKVLINGSMNHRLPHNLNITFLDLSGSRLHKELKSKIICSSGSACSNGMPSHVLMALGRSLKESESSLRLSLGIQTSHDDINNAIVIINNVVHALRK